MQRSCGRTMPSDVMELQDGCGWSRVDDGCVGGGDMTKSCRNCWTFVRLQLFIRDRWEPWESLSRGGIQHHLGFNMILLATGWRMNCIGAEVG